MNTLWDDHCGGFSYTIIYVSGSLRIGQTQISDADVAAVFTVSGTTVTVKSDLSWVGTHILKIRGQNGKYNSIDSVAFSVEIIHPCTISVVSAFELKDMFTTVNQGPVT